MQLSATLEMLSKELAESEKPLKLSFERHEGYLYKHVREQKIFQFGQFNLRYFVIDVPNAVLIVRASEKDKGTKQTIPFRDLIKVLPEDILNDEDRKCSWKHIFILFTFNRPFRLYAQTSEIKKEWIARLQEIIDHYNN